ncbi:methylosome protein WDR77-like [Glandiceps talaboti]
MASVPAAMEKYLDVIKHNSDGAVMFGASGLTGRYWAGSLWFYKDPSFAPDILKCSAGVATEAGVVDLEWIDDCRLALASDSGAIEVWQLVDGQSSFKNLFNLYEHDNSASTVSLNMRKNKAASGSADMSVKVWNLESQTSVSTYRVHLDTVWCVTWSNSNNDTFLSCSQDGSSILWDTRKAKPASYVVKNERFTSAPTCAAWQPDSQHMAAIGMESGQILIKDMRNLTQTVTEKMVHNRAVNRVAFSKKYSHWLGSVSDDSTVALTDISQAAKTIYRSRVHKDYVRGLSWSPTDNTMLTCGYDGKVHQHSFMPETLTSEGLTTPVAMDTNTDVMDLYSNKLKNLGSPARFAGRTIQA